MRARRRAERAELRRFTAAARRRRRTVLGVVAAAAALLALLLVGVFSPIFAVQRIEVLGVERASEQALQQALADQLGVPLPLVDPAEVAAVLQGFPVIESFVVESRLPDTLLVRVVERTPLALLREGEEYITLDAAGVELARGADRPAGLPVAELDAEGTGGSAFEAAIRVLRALPAGLLAELDSIRARSLDDVAFTMRGTGLVVSWGGPEESAQKARVLAALLQKTRGGPAKEFDVSSPAAPIQR